jgi:hypothetical protein
MEPALECASALWSPSTGIVDSHAYMTALLGDAERAGAALRLLTPARRGAPRRRGDGRSSTGGAEPLELEAAGSSTPPACMRSRSRARMRRLSAGRRAAAARSPRATTSRCAAARRSPA